MSSRLKFPHPRGYVAPAFEKVMRLYRNNFESGIETGSSFSAFYRGQPVINVWGGLADWGTKRAWTEDTLGLFYSSTKFVAVVTIGHLIDKGLLDFKDTISKHWPEFAQNGKGDITLESFLSNKAGLVAIDDNFQLSWLRDDPKRLEEVLAKQKPHWPPGTAHGYHPQTFGLCLNEIVKRVDKRNRTLGQYFHDEIAQPFNIDFHVGTPKPIQHRVVRLQSEWSKQDFNKSAEDFPLLYFLAFSQPKDWISKISLNNPDFMELPSPSSHGAGTAFAVAKLCGILANGGQYEGKTLLQQETIRKIAEPMSFGRDETLGYQTMYGRGAELIPVVEGNQIWYMFGHSGLGDQQGMIDPHYKVGFGYTTNNLKLGLQDIEMSKWRKLIKVLFECIHEIEGVKVERRCLTSYQDVEEERKRISSEKKSRL